MKNTLLLVLLGISFLISNQATAYKPQIKTYQYSFSKQDQFTVAFADYPKGQESLFELAYENGSPLPPEITMRRHGLKISGNNHSDDLFMYAYTKVDGLKPNTLYRVHFSLEFASNAVTGGSGTGGSPGDSVYIKIGAVAKVPQRIIDDSNHYRIALDKGNQGLDGKDMIGIGTIGVDTAGPYKLKSLTAQTNYKVLTNAQGEAWVVFGSDSGFESTTTLFYTKLRVTFNENTV